MIKIRDHIEAIERDSSLYKERNFSQRANALDFLEFHVIGDTDQNTLMLSLKVRAEKIKTELEKIDTCLFERLRADIRSGNCTQYGFEAMVNEYVDFNISDSRHQEEMGYDDLDLFINGLFPVQVLPEQVTEPEPDMVFYQKTPARIIFELVKKLSLTNDDVFFDLGSGLGQATILVNLLTGVSAIGIEFEPAFCSYAKICARQLNLQDVSFINIDARKADFSSGTIFFMYTPFSGEMLQHVVELLRNESLQRKIRIVTYGPCTAYVASQSWLSPVNEKSSHSYKLAIFAS